MQKYRRDLMLAAEGTRRIVCCQVRGEILQCGTSIGLLRGELICRTRADAC